MSCYPLKFAESVTFAILQTLQNTLMSAELAFILRNTEQLVIFARCVIGDKSGVTLLLFRDNCARISRKLLESIYSLDHL